MVIQMKNEIVNTKQGIYMLMAVLKGELAVKKPLH